MKRRHATRLAGRARPGDVVVLEATRPLGHDDRKTLAAELHDLSELTGVAFVVADHGLKVHVARPAERRRGAGWQKPVAPPRAGTRPAGLPRPGAGRRTG